MNANEIEKLAEIIWPWIPLTGTASWGWEARKHLCLWENPEFGTGASEKEKELCQIIVQEVISNYDTYLNLKLEALTEENRLLRGAAERLAIQTDGLKTILKKYEDITG